MPEFKLATERGRVCIAFGDELKIREVRDHEKIHLKYKNYVECIACGERPTFMVHFEYERRDAWEKHTQRCNYAYKPEG